MGLMGGGDSSFTFKGLVFAMVLMIMLPMMIAVFCPANLGGVDQEEVLRGYEEMTGQQASTKTSVWVLTGIYEPFGSNGSAYGYTDDGWLYGSEVRQYTPTQYQSTPQQYTVYKDSNGVFRYYSDSADYNSDTGTGHAQGSLYTSVNFDTSKKSNIFFTESNKTETEDGHWYFDYTGYRMAFQPISNYTAVNADGERLPVIATTTSLSLIWYQYYSLGSGVSGQLVLSGSNGGTAYITASQIISAFNNNTSSATFAMVFNGGVQMNIIIKIDPVRLSEGWTIQQCYDGGFWSIMVTSQSADASAYTGTDYSLNPMRILETVIDLFTFNWSDYNMSPWLGAICSIIYVVPLYALLITVCLDHAYLWVLVGILAVLQGISAIWPF